MNCLRCHHVNRSDARFCQRCGAQLDLMPTGQLSSPTCAHCGRSIRPSVQFCPYCGIRQVVSPLPGPSPSQPSPELWRQATLVPPPTISTHHSSGKHTRGYVLRHSMLIAGLILGLSAALAVAFVADSNSSIVVKPPPIVSPSGTPVPIPTADYREAVVEIGFAETGRFGLKTLERVMHF